MRPIAKPADEIRIIAAALDLATFEPKFLGVVEDVDFTTRGVALSVTRTTVHVAAERIVFPVDLA